MPNNEEEGEGDSMSMAGVILNTDGSPAKEKKQKHKKTILLWLYTEAVFDEGVISPSKSLRKQ